MRDWRCLFLIATVCWLLGGCAPVPSVPDALPTGEPLPDEPWAAAAIRDLEALRSLIRDHHPGSVDAEHPDFGRWLDEGLVHARARAQTADSYAGYLFAVRAYVNGFRDPNLVLRPGLERRFFVWPGFVVGYDDGTIWVASRDETIPRLPVLGSRLVSCDGVSATALVESLVAPYFGNWQLEADRRRFTPYLLIDRGNPFVERPKRCVFEIDGEQEERDLVWNGVRAHVLLARVADVQAGNRLPSGVRQFGDDGFWIALSDVVSADRDDTARATQANHDATLAMIDDNLRALRRAPILVVDLRGSFGTVGDSTWGEGLVRRIWGERYFEARRPHASAFDWRVSSDNALYLESLELEWASRVAAGMRTEVAANGIYYRVLPQARRIRRAGKNPVRSQVFVITDSVCREACLETVDLLLAMEDVRHVGLPTGADSLYTEIRRQPLPSGLADIAFGIKVTRGRPREHNQPHEPTTRFPPDAGIDALGLEAWIVSLAATEEATGPDPRPAPSAIQMPLPVDG